MANTGDDDLGYVGERLRERGFAVEISYRDSHDPIDLDGVDLLVLLGSDWSVHWDHVAPFVERESDAVRHAVETGTPVLGICYGGQLVSHALGGSAEPSDIVEIGWFEILSQDADLAPTGPWFEFHVDKFTPPADAVVLATTEAGPQAYRLGKVLALQFHPEVTPEIIRRWGAASAREAELYGIDFDGVYQQSDEIAELSRKRCHELVDAFLDTVAFPSNANQI